jgi:arylsulfatase A-like enzyme
LRLWAWPIAGFLLFVLLPISFLFGVDSMLLYSGPREIAVLYLTAFSAYAAASLLLSCIAEGLVQLAARLGANADRLRAGLFTLELAVLAAATAGIWIFFLRIWLDSQGISGHGSLWRGLAISGALVAAIAILLTARRIGNLRLQRNGVEVGRNSCWLGVALAVLLAITGPFLPERELPNPRIAERQAAEEPLATHVAAADSSPDILLITFDALSARDMSVYGYERDTTPGLRRFAQRAHVFTHAYSNANFTTPAITSIFTANRPWKHRVFHLQGFLRGEETQRNPIRALRDAGYSTIAFTTNPAANPNQNRSAGSFDIVHEDRSQYRRHRIYTALTVSQRLDVQNLLNLFPWTYCADALDALMSRIDPEPYRQSPEQLLAEARETFSRLSPRGKTFMWVHLWVPHHYYLPPEPFLHRFAPQQGLDEIGSQNSIPRTYEPQDEPLAQLARARYDENIAFAENLVSGFLEQLEANGALENSIVAISGDHGELFDKGIIGHGGSALYDPMIHIPLIIRTPRQGTAKVVDTVAEQIDILPTLLDLANVHMPFEVEGTSLRDAMRGEGAQQPAVSMWFERESAFAPLSAGKLAMIDWPWKLIFDVAPGGNAELYDLEADPDEDTDRALTDAGRVKAMRDRALSMLKTAETPADRE